MHSTKRKTKITNTDLTYGMKLTKQKMTWYTKSITHFFHTYNLFPAVNTGTLRAIPCMDIC